MYLWLLGSLITRIKVGRLKFMISFFHSSLVSLYNELMKIVLNNRGFTMVEVTVAMALMGLVALAFFRFSDKLVQTENKMLDLFDVNEVSYELRYNFFNIEACNESMSVFKPEGLNVFILPSELDEIVNEKKEPILEVGQKFGRITPKKISVKEVQLPKDINVGENFKYFLTLFFYFNGSGKDPMVKNKVVRIRFPVWLKYLEKQNLKIKEDGRKIIEFVKCESFQPLEKKEELLDVQDYVGFACSALNGTYDQKTKRCKTSSGGELTFHSGLEDVTPGNIEQTAKLKNEMKEGMYKRSDYEIWQDKRRLRARFCAQMNGIMAPGGCEFDSNSEAKNKLIDKMVDESIDFGIIGF